MNEDDFELARWVLVVLKMVNYRWTINEVLEQPERLLRHVMALESTGQKMLSQIMKENSPRGR